MYRFTDHGRERARHVNMLHLGTDLDAVTSEMNRIVQFMNKVGYEVDLEQGLSLYNDREMILTGSDTDMIIMGSDAARYASARYVLWCIGIGWFGIVPYWDVLWYGMDGAPEPFIEQLEPDVRRADPPLCSSREFSSDGACLLHAHIRRRDDVAASRGAYNSILIELEGRINLLMKREKVWKIRSADKKFEAFKAKVTNEGHSKPEIDLFFAAVDVLRNSRNVGAHPLDGLPLVEINRKIALGEKRAAEFNRLAERHKRPLWPPIVSSSRADYHAIVRWESSIAHMAVAWLDEYSKPPAKSQTAG